MRRIVLIVTLLALSLLPTTALADDGGSYAVPTTDEQYEVWA